MLCNSPRAAKNDEKRDEGKEGKKERGKKERVEDGKQRARNLAHLANSTWPHLADSESHSIPSFIHSGDFSNLYILFSLSPRSSFQFSLLSPLHSTLHPGL